MKTVLLTGASGVVGQAILEKLRDVSVVCLVHQTPVEGPHVTSMTGDVTLPRLGLSTDQFIDLSRRVDYVVHSAATTNFGDSEELTHSINVQGTRNVLELVAMASAPVCYISTAFVQLQQHDDGHEPNAYEASKLQAETMVRESGLPHVIVRPSVVIGDSHDGSMSRFQGFHFIWEQMLRGELPVWVPMPPNNYLDLIPQDVVADVVRALVEHDDVRGEYWVTSGDQALQLGRFMRIWEQHIPRLTGRSVQPARWVDPTIIERLFRPVFMPYMPTRMQVMIEQVLQLIGFSTETPLPSSLRQLQSELDIAPMPDLELCLIRNAEFWARKRGLALAPSRPASQR